MGGTGVPQPTHPPSLQSEAAYRCASNRDCQGKGRTTGSGEFWRGGEGEVPKTAGFEPTHLMATGVLTGRCVPYNVTLHTCEIRGWCPPEVDTVDV